MADFTENNPEHTKYPASPRENLLKTEAGPAATNLATLADDQSWIPSPHTGQLTTAQSVLTCTSARVHGGQL